MTTQTATEQEIAALRSRPYRELERWERARLASLEVALRSEPRAIEQQRRHEAEIRALSRQFLREFAKVDPAGTPELLRIMKGLI